jgi:glycosyltransferase involved in cell wall biosynthesis
LPAPSSVSVIITTHNRAGILPRAIESVLPQLFPGDELLVVDDGSTDGTAAAVEPYLDRLRFLSQANQGPGAARNLGIESSSGDYVTFLDDDDQYLPHRLEVMRTVLDRFPETVYAFTSYRHERRDGGFNRSAITRWAPQLARWAEEEAERHRYTDFAELPEGYADFPVAVGNDYLLQMRVDFVGPPFLMARRSLAGGLLRFPTDIWRYEDWEFTARLARDAPVAFLDTDPYLYRIPPDPADRLMNHDILEMADHRLTVLRRVWGRDPEFLARHEEEFLARCDRELLWRGERLLSHGRPHDAARELSQLSRRAPALLQALTLVPAPVLAALTGARRRVRRWTSAPRASRSGGVVA